MKFVLKGTINSIGSGNGLAPSRRQAIIWHIYASLGPNELNMVAITYTCHKSLLVNDHPKETRTLGELAWSYLAVGSTEVSSLFFHGGVYNILLGTSIYADDVNVLCRPICPSVLCLFLYASLNWCIDWCNSDQVVVWFNGSTKTQYILFNV